MELKWRVARQQLHHLIQIHPDWPLRTYVDMLGVSLGWVQKWAKHFQTTSEPTPTMYHAQRSARPPQPSPWSEVVVERIVSIRCDPPGGLRRMPGPLAIRYYLEQDPTLQGERIPCSSRTIAKILHQQHLIAKPRERKHEQMAVPPPGTQWDIDYKDATTVAHSTNPRKRQHHIEILNVLDPATAQVLASEARPDYTMATTLEMLVALMERLGIPRIVRLDRDHRFVGHGNRDVPTPILRMFACLGVEVMLCPPRRPDKNGFIERFHLSQKEECLLYDRPHTLEEVQTSVNAYRQHYNTERPHQSPRCRNRPPDVAFPNVPARPSLPDVVDPDAWIKAWDGRMYVRKVGRDGSVTVADQHYWPGKAYAGQYVALRIEAATRSFVIEDATSVIRTVPIRTIGGGPCSRQAWIAQLVDDAKREDGKQRNRRDQQQKDLTP